MEYRVLRFYKVAITGYRKTFFSKLRNTLRSTSLGDHKHQSNTNSCVATARESSHYFTDCACTHFNDWYRARLGLVKLNAYNKPTRVPDYCMVHSTLYRKRHNTIVNKRKKATANRFAIMGDDQIIWNQNLRPDLVVRKVNDVIIFDLTVPFENGLEDFDADIKAKLDKYKSLAGGLSINNNRVVVVAIVVGALGSWEPTNDKSLRRLCGKSDLRNMKKIIVIDTIAYSRDISHEHISRVPKDTNGRQAWPLIPPDFNTFLYCIYCFPVC